MAFFNHLITLAIFALVLIHIHSLPQITISTTSHLIESLTNKEYDAEEKLTHEAINSNMLMYYSYFASMGYCKDEQLASNMCCNYILKENWELVDHGVDPHNSLNNYVFLKSDAKKKFIFAFPGTRGALELTKEILKGFMVSLEGDDEIKVCSYFKERCDGLNDLVFSESHLNIIRSHVGYEVLFVGHSLGGAIATITSLRSALRNYIDPEKNPLVLFVINAPRTGNDYFAAEVMKRISNVFRLVRKGDLVSNVPPCVPNLHGKCQTVIGRSNKFLGEVNEGQDANSISFYYWHIGGLILMNKEMTEAVICPKDQGENFEEKECQNSLSLNIYLHNYLFNRKIGLYSRCTKQGPPENYSFEHYLE